MRRFGPKKRFAIGAVGICLVAVVLWAARQYLPGASSAISVVLGALPDIAGTSGEAPLSEVPLRERPAVVPGDKAVAATSTFPLYIEGNAPKPAKAGKPAPKAKSLPVQVAGGGASASASIVASPVAPVPAASVRCAWKTIGLPRGDVLLNEISWMGSEDDADAEWIELKNIAGRDVEIGEWRILSRDKKIDIGIRPKVLRAGDFYLLERDSDGTVAEVPADQIYDGALSNSGAWLKLLDATCHLMDEVNASSSWPEGSARTKRTMERRVAAEGWQTSDAAGGTPRSQNYIPSWEEIFASSTVAMPPPPAPEEEDLFPAAAAHGIIISVVQISGVASDDDRITLYNPGADAVDVNGWKLRKRTKSGAESSVRVLAGEIAGGSSFVWANAKYPTGADVTSTQTLSADGSVALFGPDDSLVDALAWGSGHTAPFVEGEPYPGNPEPGQVLGRRQWVSGPMDTGNNAQDFDLN